MSATIGVPAIGYGALRQLERENRLLRALVQSQAGIDPWDLAAEALADLAGLIDAHRAMLAERHEDGTLAIRHIWSAPGIEPGLHRTAAIDALRGAARELSGTFLILADGIVDPRLVPMQGVMRQRGTPAVLLIFPPRGAAGAILAFALVRVDGSVRANAAVIDAFARHVDHLAALRGRLRHREAALSQLAVRQQQLGEERRAVVVGELRDGVERPLADAIDHLKALLLDLDPDAAGVVRAAIDRQVSARICAQRIRARLQPAELDVGLVAATRALVRLVTERSGLDGHVQADAIDPEREAAVRVDVYRALEEALVNVERHAGAAHVMVRLEARRRSLVVLVEDDGVGIADPADGEVRPGILGMRERITRHGGALRIRRRARGTQVRMVVPLVGEI